MQCMNMHVHDVVTLVRKEEETHEINTFGAIVVAAVIYIVFNQTAKKYE